MSQKDRRRLSPAVASLLRDLAVAFLLVAVVFAALFAFARTWPPMVVVESGSMMHSPDASGVGTVDTGDIVVVQSAQTAAHIVTYVEGVASGYQTYGDYGDVILFQFPTDRKPIIHRPVLRVVWNASADGFDAPSLLALEEEAWEASQAEPRGLGAGDYVVLHEATHKGLNVRINFDDFVGDPPAESCSTETPCYVTMGDNNAPNYDGRLVHQGIVVGRARGELPWFGLLKLVLGGNMAWGDTNARTGAPANSWTSLTVALVVLVGAPIGLDVALSLRERARAGPKGETDNPEPETDEDGPT